MQNKVHIQETENIVLAENKNNLSNKKEIINKCPDFSSEIEKQANEINVQNDLFNLIKTFNLNN